MMLLPLIHTATTMTCIAAHLQQEQSRREEKMIEPHEDAARRLARLIADEANTCCHRGDGYREDIEQFAYEKILEALKGFGQ